MLQNMKNNNFINVPFEIIPSLQTDLSLSLNNFDLYKFRSFMTCSFILSFFHFIFSRPKDIFMNSVIQIYLASEIPGLS